jgi:hypothetical protein
MGARRFVRAASTDDGSNGPALTVRADTSGLPQPIEHPTSCFPLSQINGARASFFYIQLNLGFAA